MSLSKNAKNPYFVSNYKFHYKNFEASV